MKKKTTKTIDLSEIKKQQPKKYISKKRLARRRKFVVITALVLILGITLTVLSYTVFFPIEKIKINKTVNYNSSELLNVIGVLEGDNLLAASQSRATKVLKEKYPYVKEVEFIKHLPSTLEIKVVEYDVYAQIKVGDEYYRINEQSGLLEVTKKHKKNSPVVVGLKVNSSATTGEEISFENENSFSTIKEIISTFKDNQLKNVTLINMEDPQYLKVTYDDRIVMLLGSNSNLDKKLAHARATLESRAKENETGTLNLSRIPSEKNEASFIPRALEPNEKAKN